MCPACITAALTVASATSAGGLTVLVVKKLRAKAGTKKNLRKPEPAGNAA